MSRNYMPGLHLTVTQDGTASLWDDAATAKRIARETGEVYVYLVLSSYQVSALTTAERRATSKEPVTR